MYERYAAGLPCPPLVVAQHEAASPDSDGRSQSYAFTMTLAADALLLGRTTYEGMAQAWPAMGGNPYADHVNTITKYVVASARRHDRKASARKVELVDTTAFATGAVVHTYRPLAR